MVALTCCGIVFCFKVGYVCVPGCLFVVYKSEFGGDPRHSALEEWGSSIQGILGSICIRWQMDLWYLELCTMWELKTIFHDPSVHGAHEVNYLPLFDILAPKPLYFRSPSAFWCWGVVKVYPLQWHSMFQSHRRCMHMHSTYT